MNGINVGLGAGRDYGLSSRVHLHGPVGDPAAERLSRRMATYRQRQQEVGQHYECHLDEVTEPQRQQKAQLHQRWLESRANKLPGKAKSRGECAPPPSTPTTPSVPVTNTAAPPVKLKRKAGVTVSPIPSKSSNTSTDIGDGVRGGGSGFACSTSNTHRSFNATTRGGGGVGGGGASYATSNGPQQFCNNVSLNINVNANVNLNVNATFSSTVNGSAVPTGGGGDGGGGGGVGEQTDFKKEPLDDFPSSGGGAGGGGGGAAGDAMPDFIDDLSLTADLSEFLSTMDGEFTPEFLRDLSEGEMDGGSYPVANCASATSSSSTSTLSVNQPSTSATVVKDEKPNISQPSGPQSAPLPNVSSGSNYVYSRQPPSSSFGADLDHTGGTSTRPLSHFSAQKDSLMSPSPIGSGDTGPAAETLKLIAAQTAARRSQENSAAAAQMMNYGGTGVGGPPMDVYEGAPGSHYMGSTGAQLIRGYQCGPNGVVAEGFMNPSEMARSGAMHPTMMVSGSGLPPARLSYRAPHMKHAHSARSFQQAGFQQQQQLLQQQQLGEYCVGSGQQGPSGMGNMDERVMYVSQSQHMQIENQRLNIMQSQQLSLRAGPTNSTQQQQLSMSQQQSFNMSVSRQQHQQQQKQDISTDNKSMVFSPNQPSDQSEFMYAGVGGHHPPPEYASATPMGQFGDKGVAAGAAMMMNGRMGGGVGYVSPVSATAHGGGVMGGGVHIKTEKMMMGNESVRQQPASFGGLASIPAGSRQSPMLLRMNSAPGGYMTGPNAGVCPPGSQFDPQSPGNMRPPMLMRANSDWGTIRGGTPMGEMHQMMHWGPGGCYEPNGRVAPSHMSGGPSSAQGRMTSRSLSYTDQYLSGGFNGVTTGGPQGFGGTPLQIEMQQQQLMQHPGRHLSTGNMPRTGQQQYTQQQQHYATSGVMSVARPSGGIGGPGIDYTQSATDGLGGSGVGGAGVRGGSGYFDSGTSQSDVDLSFIEDIIHRK